MNPLHLPSVFDSLKINRTLFSMIFPLGRFVISLCFLFMMACSKPSLTAMEYFKKLPVAAFDHTTDGLSQEDKNQLLSKGESSTWTIEKKSDDQIILKSKYGFSRVTLNLKKSSATTMEVETQNEKVFVKEIWELNSLAPEEFVKKSVNDSSVTSSETPPEQPSQVPAQDLSSSLPQDVKEFQARRDRCNHWLGEEPYDEERKIFLQTKVKEDCEGTDAQRLQLMKTYQQNAEVIKVLQSYEEVVE